MIAISVSRAAVTLATLDALTVICFAIVRIWVAVVDTLTVNCLAMLRTIDTALPALTSISLPTLRVMVAALLTDALIVRKITRMAVSRTSGATLADMLRINAAAVVRLALFVAVNASVRRWPRIRLTVADVDALMLRTNAARRNRLMALATLTLIVRANAAG